MSDRQLRSRLDWGDLSLVLLFAGVTIAYLADSWAASGSLRNLVLLMPVSGLSLLLCALVLIDIVRHSARAPEPAGQEEGAESSAESIIDRYKPALLMALFALYVMTLPWFGFDVGSAVFIAAALLMDGERRLWLIAPVSVGFALGATLLFRWLLPYPMPTLVL
jgi:hypothetical protein